MRNGFLGSVAALLAGAGFTLAQPPAAPPTADPSASTFRAQMAQDNAFDEGPPPPIHENAFLNDDMPADNVRALYWANLEYLLWSIRPGNLPAVLTTNTLGAPGVIGAPGTQLIAGGSNFVSGLRNGGRVTLGTWLQPYLGCPIGAEISGFAFGKRTVDFFAASDATGAPVLTRPIVNALTGANSVFFVSAPGQFAGSFHMNATSAFNGAELNGIWQPGELHEFPDILIGVRYLSLNEDLGLSQTSTLLAGGLAGFPPGGTVLRAGNVISLMDTFSAANNFYGGQIGTRGQYDFGRFYINGFGKLAAGVTQQTMRIAGSSTLTTPTGASTTVGGGLLAVASNVGSTTHSEFSLVPEVGLNLGFWFNRHIAIHAGYSFLYWSRVIRPGNQVDPRVNPTLVPTSVQFGRGGGPALPFLPLHEQDLWAHGLNAGMTIIY